MSVTVTETNNNVTITGSYFLPPASYIQDAITEQFIRSQDAYDPAEVARFYSDFTGTLEPFVPCTGTVGNPTGGNYAYSSEGDGSFGVLTLTTFGTASGGRSGIYATDVTGNVTVNRKFVFGTGQVRFKARCVYTTAPQTSRVVMGCAATHAGFDVSGGKLMMQYGIGFLAYGSEGNWIATTANNNVLTETDTGVPVDQWSTLEIILSADGNTATWLVNGVVKRTSTNGPFFDYDFNLCAWGIELRDKLSGGSGTQTQINIDYMLLERTVSR